MAKSTEAHTKFVVEYVNELGKPDARWHYDYEKYRFGPILVEELNLPKKERKKKSKKVG